MNKSVVTSIAAARGASKKEPVTLADLATAVPIASDDAALLLKAVEKAHLLSDMRALWIAYPNLQQATEKMAKLLTFVWPSRSASGASAVGEAVVTALRRVKQGLAVDEESRDFVVSNFLDGLLSAANDVAGVHAWGYQNGKPIEQYEDSKGSFERWANTGPFTEIRFFFRTEMSSHELEGTRLKLLCAIASTKDVGVVARYK